MSNTIGGLVEDNEDVRQALNDLAWSVEISLVAGSQLLHYGHIDKVFRRQGHQHGQHVGP